MRRSHAVLSFIVCVWCGRWCITRRIRPWTSRPPKPPAEHKREKEARGVPICHIMLGRSSHQIVAPTPESPDFYLSFRFSVAGGEQRVCLVLGLTGRLCLLPACPDPGRPDTAVLADGHAVQRLIS